MFTNSLYQWLKENEMKKYIEKADMCLSILTAMI